MLSKRSKLKRLVIYLIVWGMLITSLPMEWMPKAHAASTEMENRELIRFPHMNGASFNGAYMFIDDASLGLPTTPSTSPHNQAQHGADTRDGNEFHYLQMNEAAADKRGFIRSDKKFDIANKDFKMSFILENGHAGDTGNNGAAFFFTTDKTYDLQSYSGYQRGNLGIYGKWKSTDSTAYLHHAIAVELDNYNGSYTQNSYDWNNGITTYNWHLGITVPRNPTNDGNPYITHLAGNHIGGTNWHLNTFTRCDVTWKLKDGGATNALTDNTYTLEADAYHYHGTQFTRFYPEDAAKTVHVSKDFTYQEMLNYFGMTDTTVNEGVYVGFSSDSGGNNVAYKIYLTPMDYYHIKYVDYDTKQPIDGHPTVDKKGLIYETYNIQDAKISIPSYSFMEAKTKKKGSTTEEPLTDLTDFYFDKNEMEVILYYRKAPDIQNDYEVSLLGAEGKIAARPTDPGFVFLKSGDKQTLVYQYDIDNKTTITGNDLLVLLQATANSGTDYRTPLVGTEKQAAEQHIGAQPAASGYSMADPSGKGLNKFFLNGTLIDVLDLVSTAEYQPGKKLSGGQTIAFQSGMSGSDTSKHNVVMKGLSSANTGVQNVSQHQNISAIPVATAQNNSFGALDLGKVDGVAKGVENTLVKWQLYARNQYLNQLYGPNNSITDVDTEQNVINVFVVGVDVTKPAVDVAATKENLGISGNVLFGEHFGSTGKFVKANVGATDNHTIQGEFQDDSAATDFVFTFKEGTAVLSMEDVAAAVSGGTTTKDLDL